MSGEPTVIYSAANTQQAHLLKGLLEQQGIAAWVVNDAIQIAGRRFAAGLDRGRPRRRCRCKMRRQARQFAEEFDQQTAHEPSADDGGMRAAAASNGPDWPVVPTCGERRSARCPVCGVSGTNFPWPTLQESDAGQQVLLKCEDCDDLFRPQWYRLCARCGHDFGDGIEVSQAGQAAMASTAGCHRPRRAARRRCSARLVLWLFRWSLAYLIPRLVLRHDRPRPPR